MEVCIDSVASAINAEKGGAIRVELCSNLVEGGTTPSVGMLQVIKSNVQLPVYVMIRPRGGDFLYTDDEFEVMKADIMALKSSKADGFVFGCLQMNGSVDKQRCRELIELVRPLPVTFHRAFDMTSDIFAALEAVISLGFTRVLTSGGCNTALDGVPVISELVKRAQGRITIMPGGGINENNIERILKGCNVREFHCSARSTIDSLMGYRHGGVSMGASFSPPEYSVKVTDSNKVQTLINLADSYWDENGHHG